MKCIAIGTGHKFCCKCVFFFSEIRHMDAHFFICHGTVILSQPRHAANAALAGRWGGELCVRRWGCQAQAASEWLASNGPCAMFCPDKVSGCLLWRWQQTWTAWWFGKLKTFAFQLKVICTKSAKLCPLSKFAFSAQLWLALTREHFAVKMVPMNGTALNDIRQRVLLAWARHICECWRPQFYFLCKKKLPLTSMTFVIQRHGPFHQHQALQMT